MSDKRQVTFNADKETVETAKEKLEYGELSEELRGRLDEIAYGAQTTKREQLKEQLEKLRGDKQEVHHEIEELENEEKEIDRKIRRVEEQLDAIRDTDGEYNGALEMIEVKLERGERMFSTHEDVERAAQIGQKPKQDVIQDLRERNPDLPDEAFELSAPHEPTNWRETTEI